MNEILSRIINRYRLAAEAHGKATTCGDYKSANRNYDEMIKSLELLKGFGAEGSDALVELCEDDSDAVASWAATHTLRVDEPRALLALRRVASKSGIVAFGAEMVMEQWEKGELTLPEW